MDKTIKKFNIMKICNGGLSRGHMAFCAVITLSRHCRPPKFLPHLQISRFPQYCTSPASRITMSSASETKLTAPYGSWKSPITADVVSGSDKRLGGFDTDSFGRLYWLESRPAESGFVSFCNYVSTQ